MSGVQNDYNQAEGHPLIKVGNWSEERALLESTGLSRGAAGLTQPKAIPLDTASRCIQHSQQLTPQQWQSTQQHQMIIGRSEEESSKIQSRENWKRENVREKKFREEAERVQAEWERENKKREEEEIKQYQFGNRPMKLNRTRIITPLSSSSSSSSSTTSDPTTLISPVLSGRPSEAGFGKNTTFSQPIGEYRKSEWR